MASTAVAQQRAHRFPSESPMAAAAPRSYKPRLRRTMATTDSIIGTSNQHTHHGRERRPRPSKAAPATLPPCRRRTLPAQPGYPASPAHQRCGGSGCFESWPFGAPDDRHARAPLPLPAPFVVASATITELAEGQEWPHPSRAVRLAPPRTFGPTRARTRRSGRRTRS